MPNPPTGVPKPRKPRPSRARGLRTTTGCLTCRKRRVKCDETKPFCGPCTKSKRDCMYGPNTAQDTTQTVQNTIEDSTHLSQPDTTASVAATDSPELRFDLSPLNLSTSLPSPNSAPFEWYDLLAEDAINNIQRHNLGFDQTSLSRRQSPVPESQSVTSPSTASVDPHVQSPRINTDIEHLSSEPWNSTHIIELAENELALVQHFVNVVGPILDLFDPARHFSTIVPRLAVRNVGLLKSLLAVAARHMALHTKEDRPSISEQTPVSSISIGSEPGGRSNPFTQVATQYYYETLHYLSQNLLYPSYTRSGMIIATAILISTYEMFDAEGSYSDGGWERHLRGIFWIQRGQNIDGESMDGLRRAAWWAWLRQDIWVAFRENRRTLTIWRPRKRLMDLSADELATRIVYITARCVDFAANEKNYDMGIRIEQGDKLLQALEDWHLSLPNCFKPIYTLPPSENGLFSPIWINPPTYAAAVQTFHFARIVVIINQPSMGGMAAFRQRQKLLDDSVETICGIAMMQQNDLASAFVNFQALYAAGLCVQNPVKQQAIKQLLEATLDISKFPPKTLLSDLSKFWRETL